MQRMESGDKPQGVAQRVVIQRRPLRTNGVVSMLSPIVSPGERCGRGRRGVSSSNKRRPTVVSADSFKPADHVHEVERSPSGLSSRVSEMYSPSSVYPDPLKDASEQPTRMCGQSSRWNNVRMINFPD